MVQLLQDEGLQRKLGEKAREGVKKNFLMTRYLEEYLGLLGAFQPSFKLRR
jgi:trehalose synthase